MSVKPIGVANPSFTLERAASDCPPLQFVREFTMNSIEAIEVRRDAGLRPGVARKIVWREFAEIAARDRDPSCAASTPASAWMETSSSATSTR